jgi:hypothetical protein
MLIYGESEPKGTPVGSLLLSPAASWNANLPLNVPASHVITLLNSAAPPLQIKSHRLNHEAFTVVVTTLEPGKRFQFSINVKAGLPVGTHKAFLILETNSAETPQLEIPLTLHVLSPVTASPSRLRMENIFLSNPDQEVPTNSKFIWVRYTRGEGLELKKLSSDLPFVTARVESVEGNKETYLVRVTFSARPPVGTHTGKVIIETNNKDVPLIEIPLSITAK